MNDILLQIDWQDLLALGVFVLCWVGYALYADQENHDNLLAVTNRYRLQWMREMLRRENRNPDAIMVGNLQRAIAFFANTSIFILIGLVSMLNYHDRANSIFAVLPFAKPNSSLLWEVKIFLMIVIFIYAFFKYTWSLRQYNYAGIFIVSAAPSKDIGEERDKIASAGAYLVGNAARHFNNGLRAYYFGLAALAWFVHPYLFITATAWVVYVTYRREYRSATLRYLSQS